MVPQVSIAASGYVQMTECKPDDLENLLQTGLQACRDGWSKLTNAQAATASATSASQPAIDALNGGFAAANAAEEEEEVDSESLKERDLIEAQQKAARVICRFARYCRSVSFVHTQHVCTDSASMYVVM
jgi:hypothetical protein